MKTSLDPQTTAAVLGRLAEGNRELLARYPGESPERQPLHTVYGGAQLFKADTGQKLGQLALRMWQEYAPDAETLAAAVGLPADADWLPAVHARTTAKLEREAVEDFRIDFEDGFGIRPDDEEDHHAERAAQEVARGLAEGTLPPFIGIRVKTLSEELKQRSLRTLDIFVSTLLDATGGTLPPNFVITLPKIAFPGQVEAFCDLLDQLERQTGLADGSLQLELMIELTQTIFDPQGRSNLPLLLAAARGRCRGAHFGTYDYTATCQITAEHQVMDHSACDFALHMMKIAYANTGIFLSDGSTNILPAPPHSGRDAPLTDAQRAENRQVVHGSWRTSYGHIRHSLINGFYQGWDLHPGQIPIRYAACYAFFLEGLQAASERLTNFIDKAAQATLVGDVFDDAATGQGLLNYFLRALNGGAVSLEEVQATGLTLEEIQSRSFLAILENRRKV